MPAAKNTALVYTVLLGVPVLGVAGGVVLALLFAEGDALGVTQWLLLGLALGLLADTALMFWLFPQTRASGDTYLPVWGSSRTVIKRAVHAGRPQEVPAIDLPVARDYASHLVRSLPAAIPQRVLLLVALAIGYVGQTLAVESAARYAYLGIPALLLALGVAVAVVQRRWLQNARGVLAATSSENTGTPGADADETPRPTETRDAG
ncbi:hypothetical protein [Compostimonas suwonensis]|uniref:Uncharacterized protein n=1 Tax=Compostimonas suwonensis TaxID=1048394 RepID=A0A2M9C3T9_9MICO|nr:hypothetical protein [Compostimonas suwonensis]PJJ65194.1 hypothetical protein CLV54_0223 [Compostimonas suwonensis]